MRACYKFLKKPCAGWRSLINWEDCIAAHSSPNYLYAPKLPEDRLAKSAEA